MKKTPLLAIFSTLFLLTGCLSQNSDSNKPDDPVDPGGEGGGSDVPPPVPEGGYGYNHYNGYYGNLTWQNSEDLKAKLHNIISKDVNFLSYTWDINTVADHSLYDLEYVDVIYSDTDVLATKTNTFWQREHVFPASLMTGLATGAATGIKGRATDYHNLFAGESSANSSRGNKNYGTANISDKDYQNRGVEAGGYSFDPKNFEPGEKDKGRLARSIFYMATMYSVTENERYQPLNIIEDYVEYSAGNCQFAIGNLTTLLSWCKHSVDLMEYQHNELVYSTEFNGIKQNNRNPYVDYPELIDYAFGSKKNDAGDLTNLRPSSVQLDLEKTGIQHYAIRSAKRECSVGETYTKNDVSLVGIGYDFKEIEVDKSVFTLEDVQLNEKGNKEITITTDKNIIKLNVNVGDSTTQCSYNYEFSGNIASDYGFNSLSANKTSTATLAGMKWNITSQNDADMRKGGGDIGAIFGFSTSKRVGVLTFETVDELVNVNCVKLGCNTSGSTTMNVKIYVADDKVAEYSVKSNSKETSVRIFDLAEQKSGKVKIVFTPDSAQVIVKSISINEVK